jgi:hypothetical protein
MRLYKQRVGLISNGLLHYFAVPAKYDKFGVQNDTLDFGGVICI